MDKIFIPAKSPEEWKSFLADSDRHWAKGHSAKALVRFRVRLAKLQFGFELDTFPVLIKRNRSRQDGGANLYFLQL